MTPLPARVQAGLVGRKDVKAFYDGPRFGWGTIHAHDGAGGNLRCDLVVSAEPEITSATHIERARSRWLESLTVRINDEAGRLLRAVQKPQDLLRNTLDNGVVEDLCGIGLDEVRRGNRKLRCGQEIAQARK